MKFIKGEKKEKKFLKIRLIYKNIKKKRNFFHSKKNNKLVVIYIIIIIIIIFIKIIFRIKIQIDSVIFNFCLVVLVLYIF
jgi:hypothetical protein